MWPDRVSGRPGCVWIGSSGRWGSRKTPKRDGSSSNGRWRSGGGRKILGDTKPYGGGGVTGRKLFGRNCWGKWPTGRGRIITRRNDSRATRRRPGGFWRRKIGRASCRGRV